MTGHNKIRDAVHALAVTAAPSSCLEPMGLLPSRPLARPADVLSGAGTSVYGCCALDVGVACPWAAGNGDDCCAAMRRRKLDKARGWLAEAASQGIGYEPMICSSFGRWEREADRILDDLARRAARRHGLSSHAGVARRARCALGVEIMKRLVVCVRRCLPTAGDLVVDWSEEALLG